MTQLPDLITAIWNARPPSVAMTWAEQPQLAGVSIFFDGPGGRAACPLLGITDALETDDIQPLVDKALQAANSVAGLVSPAPTTGSATDNSSDLQPTSDVV